MSVEATVAPSRQTIPGLMPRFLVRSWITPVLIFAGCLALYLGTHSISLDDWDSFNFARAIGHFDVAHNQPQSPGYPVYVALARVVHLATGNQQAALLLLSAIAGAGAVVALYGIGLELNTPLAALLLAVCPLFWISSDMALSDVPGLATTCLAVWLALRGERFFGVARLPWLAASGLVAGLALGVRPQDGFISGAVLVYVLVRTARQKVAARTIAASLAALAVACLAWLVPLVASLGGPGQAWREATSRGSYVGIADSLLARPLTWPNVIARMAEFGSVFSPYLGGPRGAGAITMLVIALAVCLLAILSQNGRAVQVALVWLVPYSVFMILWLRPDDPRKVLPAIPPLLVLLAAARPKTVASLACAALAGWFAICSAPLVRTLTTVPAPPEQAAAFIATQLPVNGTVVVAGDSYNAISYRDPALKLYLLDDLNQQALLADLQRAQRLVVLDKEGFSPPASWVAVDSRTFARDPLVLPKAAQVWLTTYVPLPADSQALRLPQNGEVRIGTPEDAAYLLGGWNRPETIAGVTARWSAGESQLRFFADRSGDATLTLVGTAYPAGEQLTVMVNGQLAGKSDMGRDWAPYTFAIPATLLHGGAVNTVTLQHSAVTSAFAATGGLSLDQRAIAAAYQSFSWSWR
ncbi:MAG: glycosyltransferase family 39 protein [Chloroflexi bacterium]|nr:glycosyltransferase family 39 protein [Chloroflexota bacterium]